MDLEQRKKRARRLRQKPQEHPARPRGMEPDPDNPGKFRIKQTDDENDDGDNDSD